MLLSNDELETIAYALETLLNIQEENGYEDEADIERTRQTLAKVLDRLDIIRQARAHCDYVLRQNGDF